MTRPSDADAALVLGLDGGGTKSTMALCDGSGTVVCRARTGGINPFDQPGWRRVFDELLEHAAGARDRVVHACFGMPGFGEVAAISAAQTAAIDAWRSSTPVTVVNDVEAAFLGAFGHAPGILVLAGTGSMVWARDDAGEGLRVGGWGELIGDEGSAYWIGLEALRRLTWIFDGRLHDDDFLESLREATGTRDGDELLRWCYGHDHLRSRVAAIAPTVSSLADTGNPTARGLLDDAARLLWEHARAARERLRFTAPVTYSYAGGAMHSPFLRDALRARADTAGSWVEPSLPPLGGALWQAAVRAGWPPTREWVDTLRTQLAEAAT